MTRSATDISSKFNIVLRIILQIFDIFLLVPWTKWYFKWPHKTLHKMILLLVAIYLTFYLCVRHRTYVYATYLFLIIFINFTCFYTIAITQWAIESSGRCFSAGYTVFIIITNENVINQSTINIHESIQLLKVSSFMVHADSLYEKLNQFVKFWHRLQTANI